MCTIWTISTLQHDARLYYHFWILIARYVLTVSEGTLYNASRPQPCHRLSSSESNNHDNVVAPDGRFFIYAAVILICISPKTSDARRHNLLLTESLCDRMYVEICDIHCQSKVWYHYEF